jgi:ribonuclease III
MRDPFEAILGHVFRRPELLSEALTHRSAAQGKGRARASNERLEFIGDRVLGLIMAEWLAERFPREQEGELGRRLAYLVSQPVLAGVAETIGLAAALSVSPGEAKAGVAKRATVLADALEAALGALYMDGGLSVARDFVRHAWNEAMIIQTDPPKDAKTTLQEWAQKRGLDLPAYAIASQSGPPHAPEFTVTVTVGSSDASGIAGNRRAAEQRAAEALLQRLAP